MSYVPSNLKVHEKVIIHYNPHHTKFEEELGIVTDVAHERFDGDMISIRYMEPSSKEGVVEPFHSRIVEQATRSSLEQLALKYEAKARIFRKIAVELPE